MTEICYLRSAEAHAVEMDGEFVMMGKEQGAYFGLKDVAATIWQALEEPRTLDQLVDTVVDAYEVDIEECRRDTAAFLVELEDAGIVVRQPA